MNKEHLQGGFIMKSLENLDNRYVVHSRNIKPVSQTKASQCSPQRKVENGLVCMTPTPYWQLLKSIMLKIISKNL